MAPISFDVLPKLNVDPELQRQVQRTMDRIHSLESRDGTVENAARLRSQWANLNNNLALLISATVTNAQHAKILEGAAAQKCLLSSKVQPVKASDYSPTSASANASSWAGRAAWFVGGVVVAVGVTAAVIAYSVTTNAVALATGDDCEFEDDVEVIVAVWSFEPLSFGSF